MVGVIGLFYTIVQVLSATGAVLLGGSSVLIGRFMGSGDIKKTNGIYSLNICVTTLVSLLVSAFCLIFPGIVSDICGASPELRDTLSVYVRGIAIGAPEQAQLRGCRGDDRFQHHLQYPVCLGV